MTLAKLGAMAALSCVVALPCAGQDDALAASRDRWHAAGLSAYEYGYQKYCECHPESPPETVVTVRGSEVVAVRHRPQNSAAETPAEERNLQFYWTVDGLFTLLESAFGRGALVRADYDGALGYPTRIYIDYDRDFIGDELDLRITRVAAIS
jgi:Family of unknown function (DUF6174)